MQRKISIYVYARKGWLILAGADSGHRLGDGRSPAAPIQEIASPA